MNYETPATMDETDREHVYRWLREHNRAENGAFVSAMESGAAKSLIVLARNDHGAIVGGLIGETVLDWLRISILAVDPAARRNGAGSRLLAEAEGKARQRNCRKAYVDTMTYQGPEFYMKAGYAEVGRLRDWDSHGHDKVFFTKTL